LLFDPVVKADNFEDFFKLKEDENYSKSSVDQKSGEKPKEEAESTTIEDEV